MKISKIEYIIVFLLSVLYYDKYGGSFFRIFPVTILEILIIILALYIYVKKKEKIIFKKSYGLVLFLIIMILWSLMWTNAPIYGTSKVFYLFLTVVLFYFIAPIIYRHFLLFLKIQVFFYALYLFDLYLAYGFIDTLILEMNMNFRLGWEEDQTVLFHPIGISRYITMGILNIIFLLYVNKKNNKIIIFIYSILVVYGSIYLFFSGTRTPILAMILSLLFLVVINQYTKIKTKVMVVSIPILLFTLFQVFLSLDLGWSSEQKKFIEYRYMDNDSAIGDRSWQFNRATKNIDLDMVLLGKGSGDFAYEFYKKDIRQYSHNLFTEIFFENGIFPLLSIFWIILIIFYHTRKSNSKVSNYVIVLFYNGLINAMFSGDLLSNNFIFGYFIMIIYFSKYNTINKKIGSRQLNELC